MSPLPADCEVAFKEWSEICEALLTGRQTIILRKGGIEEGPGEFRPEHQTFWLYPTYVHQTHQKMRGDDSKQGDEVRRAADPTAPVAVRALAVVKVLWRIRSEEQLIALTPFHFWTNETMRQRFHYRRPGLWLLGVRVFRQEKPWLITPTPEQLGCKSWVHLGSAFSTERLRPVLSEEAWTNEIGRLRSQAGLGNDAEFPDST
jgi:hypothetical protein